MDLTIIEFIASELKKVHDSRVQVAVVVGSDNIFRGISSSAKNIDRASADYIGMLGTVMNAAVLQDALEKMNVQTRVLSAIDIPQLAEPFIRRRAVRHLEKGRVIIFAGGTGNPFFSTDLAAVVRSLEIKAEVILKAANVGGVYSANPSKDSAATGPQRITFQEALERRFDVIDSSAISLCMQNNLPLAIFDLHPTGNILRLISGETGVGTWIF